MRKQFRVRFNLGRGKHYLKWKVSLGDEVNYYDPSEVQILMYNCSLNNNKDKARQIYEGANKDVCAWVICSEIRINKATDIKLKEGDQQLMYNPRRYPHWFNDKGDNLDNKIFDVIVSSDRKLFAI